MKAKYPGNYFMNYFNKFNSKGIKPDENGYSDFEKLFIKKEGYNEFAGLVKEIEKIDRNDDWLYFENIAAENKIFLSREVLKDLAYSALDYFYGDTIEKPDSTVQDPAKPTFHIRDGLPLSLKPHSDPKRAGILYTLLGFLLVIVVIILILTGFFQVKHISATVVFSLVGVIGIILMVMGLSNVKTSRRAGHRKNRRH